MTLLRTIRRTLAVATFGAACLAGTAASATTIFTLDSSGCCGAGPFGTVTLTDTGSGIDVLVSLAAGVGFVKTASNPANSFDALMFNLAGNPALAVTFITAGFIIDSTAPLIHADGSGSWQYGIKCSTACGTGGSAPYAGPLEFIVTTPGLTEASFIATAASNGNYFAADVCDKFPKADGPGCAGSTGMVWTSSPPVRRSVPEPATLALLGIGALAWARLSRGKGERTQRV
jgi:hypothetical protein